MLKNTSIKLKLATAVILTLSTGGFTIAHAQSKAESQSPITEIDARVRADEALLRMDQVELDRASLKLDEAIAGRDERKKELSNILTAKPAPSIKPANPLENADSTTSVSPSPESIKRDIDQMRTKLDQLHAKGLITFESSEEFKNSFAEFDKARQELKAPTDRVLDELSQSRDFQEMVAAGREAKEKEQQIRKDSPSDSQAIAAAEKEFIAADKRIQAMEEEALKRDATVLALRKKVDATQEPLQKMRAQWESQFQQSPEVAGTINDIKVAQEKLRIVTPTVAATPESTAKTEVVAITPSASDLANPAVAEAQSKLDAANADVITARAEVTKYRIRVADDKVALEEALHDKEVVARDANRRDNTYSSAPPAPAAPETAYQPAYSPPTYSPPSYDPPVAVTRSVYVEDSPVYYYPDTNYSYSSYYSDYYPGYRSYCHQTYYPGYYYSPFCGSSLFSLQIGWSSGGHRDRGYYDSSYNRHDYYSNNRNDNYRYNNTTATTTINRTNNNGPYRDYITSGRYASTTGGAYTGLDARNKERQGQGTNSRASADTSAYRHSSSSAQSPSNGGYSPAASDSRPARSGGAYTGLDRGTSSSGSERTRSEASRRPTSPEPTQVLPGHHRQTLENRPAALAPEPAAQKAATLPHQLLHPAESANHDHHQVPAAVNLARHRVRRQAEAANRDPVDQVENLTAAEKVLAEEHTLDRARARGRSEWISDFRLQIAEF